jgi:hypothetical protein
LLSIGLTLDGNLDLPQMIDSARRVFKKPFFFEAFATACWNLWKKRNALIFYQVAPTLDPGLSLSGGTFSFDLIE